MYNVDNSKLETKFNLFIHCYLEQSFLSQYLSSLKTFMIIKEKYQNL